MNFDFHIGIDARMYSSNFTGIGRYCHELTAHLFALRPDWRFTLFLAPEECERLKVPANVRKIAAPEKHYSVGEQTSFLKRITKEKFDLFHFPHFNAPLLYRGKSIVTIHDLTISFFPGKKKTAFFHKLGYRAVLKNIVKKSARVIAVSAHTKQDLQTLLGTPEEKIRVIWNGLGAEFLRENQNPEELGKIGLTLAEKHHLAQPYFLYTGVHREHKNLVGMIRAFGKFHEKYPDVQLLITGKEDPYYPEVRATIEELKLSAHVKLIGLVSEAELRALFFHANLFVFPSFYEGFGLPPLEAMSMEIPVIASNASAVPEVCGTAAEYFDPWKTPEITEKMLLVFENQLRRQELIAAGKERIRLFSWEKMARETVAVYEEILKAGS